MKTFNVDELRTLNPCYDPTEKLPVDWNETMVVMMQQQQVPLIDRIWAVGRPEVIPELKIRELTKYFIENTSLTLTSELSSGLVASLTQDESNAQGVARFAVGELVKQGMENATLILNSLHPTARRALYDVMSELIQRNLVVQSDVENKVIEYLNSYGL